MTAFYEGNRAALSSIGYIRKRTDDVEIGIQLDNIEEEVIQLRTFINENHPGNDLPLELAPRRQRSRGN